MIDIIMMEPLSFVCASAQTEISTSPVVGETVLANKTSGYSGFQAGDNIKILSMGYIVPSFVSLFTIAGADLHQSNVLRAGIYRRLVSGGPATALFQSAVPFGPYETAIDQFTDNSAVSSTFQLEFSREGVPLYVRGNLIPASMDGKKIAIGFFVKVEHSLPMVFVP